MPNMKSLGRIVSDKMTENLVGGHPGTIPVEFGLIPIIGTREEVV